MSTGLYRINYSNFGSDGTNQYGWDYIKIESYESKPVFAEDDQTQWTTHHSISGTAILRGSTQGMDDCIIACRKALSKSHRLLTIHLDSDLIVSTGTNDFDKADGLAQTDTTLDMGSAPFTDTAGYPRCSFVINKFVGNNHAMVAFTFEWMETMIDATLTEDGQANYGVLSHQWRQRFSIAENGLQTWTVEGSLRVRPWFVPSNPLAVGEVQLGRNPDSYRRLVMPEIPSNFRVKRMDWGTDSSGENLIYTIVLQEHARRLPFPATRGTGTFVFKTSIESEAGLLGVKMFDAELEGDAHSSTPALLAALLSASEQRIKWTGASKDLITSMEIRESEIFSKKVIGLRVTARGIDPNVVSAINGQGLADMNFGILEDFLADGELQAISPDVHGAALICSYKRQLFIPYAGYNQTDFPVAQLMTLENSPTTGVTGGENDSSMPYVEQVYEVTEVVEDPPIGVGESMAGELWGEEYQSTEDKKFKYLKVRGTERIGVNYNIHVFTTHTENKRQVPWQVNAPDIFIESDYTLSQHDNPPPQMFYKLPTTNCVVLEQQTSVEAGEISGNGHRVYHRHFKRKVQLLSGYVTDDVGVNYASINIGVGEGVTATVKFQYPNFPEKMRRPIDPRTDNHTTTPLLNMFDYMADTLESYPVSFDIPISVV